MSDTGTLDKILINTEVLKKAVIKKTKTKEKSKTAQKKFKKIGANVKLELAEIIEHKCKDLNINPSQYIKQLINKDLISADILITDSKVINENISCLQIIKIKLTSFFSRLEFS